MQAQSEEQFRNEIQALEKLVNLHKVSHFVLVPHSLMAVLSFNNNCQ